MASFSESLGGPKALKPEPRMCPRSITGMCRCLALAEAHTYQPICPCCPYWVAPVKRGCNTEIKSPASKFVTTFFGPCYVRPPFCKACVELRHIASSSVFSCAWCQDAAFTVYILMYVYVYMYMYMDVYIMYMYTSTDTCTHIYMYTCIHVCIYVCMYVCMYACKHVCMYVCVCR